jgi:hypothetical protein
VGCDVHTVAQKRDEQGKWTTFYGEFAEGPAPFDWRQYGLYGWLAGVRNYSDITPISEPRGLPDDFNLGEWEDESGDWLGDHSYSWLSVDELLAVDYDQVVEDRGVSQEIRPGLVNGGATCEPGGGEQTTLRDFLGERYFKDLYTLKALGAERIVFGFDS